MASSLVPSSVPDPEFTQWNSEKQSPSSNSPPRPDRSKTPNVELSPDSVKYEGNSASSSQPSQEFISDDISQSTSSSASYSGTENSIDDQKNPKSTNQNNLQNSASKSKRKRRGIFY